MRTERNALTRCRVEKGLTQEALAQKSQLSLKTIQLWERRGTYAATVSKLMQAAEALGVDISEILC